MKSFKALKLLLRQKRTSRVTKEMLHCFKMTHFCKLAFRNHMKFVLSNARSACFFLRNPPLA